MIKPKVSVLGCGRWGTFLAWYSSFCGNQTILWGREQSNNFNTLLSERKNEFLTLPPDVELSSDLSYALTNSDIIIISIKSQALRSLLEQIKKYDYLSKTFILCMKGIENNTNLRLSQVFYDVLGSSNVVIWVGPGHVQSFIKGVPNCMVIDGENETLKQNMIDIFSSELIRFYIGCDLIGNEIGAAAKNVVGIAAGMLDGLKLTSLKGALMARAPREIARLIEAMGGNIVSAYGLAHLGDYEATLFSVNSNNRAYGEKYIIGGNFNKLAEGITTLDSLIALSQEKNIDMPISQCLYSIFYQNSSPQEALHKLFLRPIKQEFI